MSEEQKKDDGIAVKYHAHIPFDLLRRSAFVPDEILDAVDDKQAYLQTIVNKLVTLLFSADATKYVVVSESKGQTVKDGDKIFHGRYIEVRLPVGNLPKILDENDRPLGNVASDIMVEVNRN